MMVVAVAARAETRPQYGGVLHVAMRAAPVSLDPADSTQPDSFARRSLTMLMFDTLVSPDENGRVLPSLATAWQADASSQHWRFRVRPGVKFHDGTLLTAEIAAGSLRAANPSWNVIADADSVVIEWANSNPDLLAELALPRNAIARRNGDSKPSGTGPFHIVDWQPGKKLVLAAEEDCWRGRPFLDAIEIETGKSFRDQMTALELGKADLVEMAPEQAHRVSQERQRLETSMPVELLALVFARDAATPEEKLLRQALALSVERSSIRSVLLQGVGQPTAGILPNWMSAYGFVFPADADLSRARQARNQVPRIPTWTLGYDGTDPLARLLAERITLNAKDAGLLLQPTPATTADLRLMRIPLASIDPWIALADVASLAGLPLGKKPGGVEDLYASEAALLATERVIPLFHLPVSYASTTILKDWALRPDGSWSLADAWLENEKQ
jgi:peptide/nickel transport system substrate-binding protein